ncbi:hypothetical protein Y032_0050g1939 [Ancylostoma ceylanicum]|uniref:Uncharacterized protein n=1 Tax=Ancylostoma ceylanicum TaxID=53326 RepID=A0A016UA77_9BILA|nr:hypothetical protein Y032_0050g1939 [Ancylostoma ceylanicum]
MYLQLIYCNLNTNTFPIMYYRQYCRIGLGAKVFHILGFSDCHCLRFFFVFFFLGCLRCIIAVSMRYSCRCKL